MTVASVTAAPDGTVGVTLAPGSIVVVFGGTDQLAAKVVALHSVLVQLPPGDGARIDVRVPDAPVLTAGKNSSMVSTTQGG